ERAEDLAFAEVGGTDLDWAARPLGQATGEVGGRGEFLGRHLGRLAVHVDRLVQGDQLVRVERVRDLVEGRDQSRVVVLLVDRGNDVVRCLQLLVVVEDDQRVIFHRGTTG